MIDMNIDTHYIIMAMNELGMSVNEDSIPEPTNEILKLANEIKDNTEREAKYKLITELADILHLYALEHTTKKKMPKLQAERYRVKETIAKLVIGDDEKAKEILNVEAMDVGIPVKEYAQTILYMANKYDSSANELLINIEAIRIKAKKLSYPKLVEAQNKLHYLLKNNDIECVLNAAKKIF